MLSPHYDFLTRDTGKGSFPRSTWALPSWREYPIIIIIINSFLRKLTWGEQNMSAIKLKRWRQHEAAQVEEPEETQLPPRSVTGEVFCFFFFALSLFFSSVVQHHHSQCCHLWLEAALHQHAIGTGPGSAGRGQTDKIITAVYIMSMLVSQGAPAGSFNGRKCF